MQGLTRLQKPAKIFVLVMIIITFIFIGAISYLEITNNNIIEAMSRYFTGDTESEIVIDEVISFNKKEIKDDNLNEGMTEVRQKGVDGKKKLVFRVTKDRNGEEINRTLVREEIIIEPVDEISAVGAKVQTSVGNDSISSGQTAYNNSQYVDNNQYQGEGDLGQNNPSSNQSQSDDTVVYHYCANSTPYFATDGHMEENADGTRHYVGTWRRYFFKTNYPCAVFSTKSKLWSGTVEAPSSDYYSLKVIEYNNGPIGYVLETRIQECGSNYVAPDSTCKTY